LVTGASGFIGEEVALGLRRAGFEVYGLVRNEEKGKYLKDNEVNVVIGDLLNPESYIEICRQCSIIVHTAADYANYEKVDSTTINTIFESANDQTTKKIFIYTSGILVLPDNPNRVMDENEPTLAKGTLKNRPLFEKQVLSNKNVIGVVVRPAYVFGKKSRHFVHHFAQAEQGKVIVKGNPNIIWSQVNIDDLVDGYVRIAQSPSSVIEGQVFHFADDARYSNLVIAQGFAKAAGFRQEIEIDLNGGLEMSQKTVIVDHRKATRLLGWVPRHLLLLDEVDLYYRTWKAKQILQ